MIPPHQAALACLDDWNVIDLGYFPNANQSGPGPASIMLYNQGLII